MEMELVPIQLRLPFPVATAPASETQGEDQPEVADPEELLTQLLGRDLRLCESRYLHGPIVVDKFGADWDLPGWLPEAIVKGRMAQIVVEAQTEVREHDRRASLEEVVAVLVTAGHAYPLHREAADVFVWACAQVLHRHNRGDAPAATLRSLFGEEQGKRYEELDPHGSQELLDRLQRDIRSKVVKAAKKNRRKK